MQVSLPSNGILGCKFVDIRQPRFSDLREVQNMNQEDKLLKVSFVKNLFIGEVDLTKITKYDIEYLYDIAVFSINYNQFSFTVTCDCGNKIKSSYSLKGKTVKDLQKFKHPHKLIINKKEYSFHIMSAQNDIDACLYALNSDLNFDEAYEDACAACILGYPLEDVEKVRELDYGIYFSALLFDKVCYHGLILEEKLKCSECGKDLKVDLEMNTDFIKLDVKSLMAFYSKVATVLDFDTFINFSIPEFTAYIEALNSQNK